MADAFGVVAMVAMTPLITIQVIGLIYKLQAKHADSAAAAGQVTSLDAYADDAIIEL